TMLGPVFHLELLLGSRRGQHERLRRVFAGWLVVQFVFLYWNYWEGLTTLARYPAWIPPPSVLAQTHQFISSFVTVFIIQHFLVLGLAAPAFVAGAVTEEKTRGTLEFLLCADLSSWEIVAGKLFGRLALVGGLGLAELPFVALMTALGGFDAILIAV